MWGGSIENAENSNLEIGVKFCGLCKPEIDTKKLFSILADKIENSKIRNLSKFDKIYPKDYELIIMINGCESSCLLKSSSNSAKKHIWVKGFIYKNKKYTDEKNLAEKILIEILDYISFRFQEGF